LDDKVANIPTIEAAAKKAFRIGLGPFELMNLSGIPIAMHSAETLGAKMGDFYAPTKALKTQYSKKEPWPLNGEVDEGKLKACQDRLLGVVFYVACQMLDEKVCGISETDLGAKVGLRWALGPFELMNKVGNEKVASLVEDICRQHTFLAVPQSLKRRISYGDPWPVQYVNLKVDGDLAQIIFQRPEAMNALNQTVVAQLGKAFDKANADPKVETIVLRGKGKAFVAGADIGFFLKKIKGNAVHKIREFAKEAQDVFLRMEASPKWVVCLMDGLALGGGAELALACDTIVATPKASVGFPETGIGIYPGLGGTQRSLRAVGLPLAKYLVMTGKVLKANQAHEVGLIEYLVPQGQAMKKIKELASNRPLTKKTAQKPVLNGKWAEISKSFEDEAKLKSLMNGELLDEKDSVTGKIAKMLSQKAPLAVRWAGEIMDQGSKLPLEQGLKLELDRLEDMFKTKDALEGLSSLVERRRPQFTAE
jgi:enoyl-CoA hydratase/3-hydroxyacyl-CoA dehydrogenase